MAKAYISRWKFREGPEDHITDYWFTSNPESAAFWGTKEGAENDCVIFNRQNISIDSAAGQTHVGTFEVEQRAPNEYVVFCDAPFMKTPGFPCQCRGGSCSHHSLDQPCPNKAVPPIAVIHDPAPNRPVLNSEYGLCEECHARESSENPE